VQIGDLKPGHLQALRENKWLPLDVLLGVDSESPYYNEHNPPASSMRELGSRAHVESF